MRITHLITATAGLVKREMSVADCAVSEAIEMSKLLDIYWPEQALEEWGETIATEFVQQIADVLYAASPFANAVGPAEPWISEGNERKEETLNELANRSVHEYTQCRLSAQNNHPDLFDADLTGAMEIVRQLNAAGYQIEPWDYDEDWAAVPE